MKRRARWCHKPRAPPYFMVKAAASINPLLTIYFMLAMGAHPSGILGDGPRGGKDDTMQSHGCLTACLASRGDLGLWREDTAVICPSTLFHHWTMGSLVFWYRLHVPFRRWSLRLGVKTTALKNSWSDEHSPECKSYQKPDQLVARTCRFFSKLWTKRWWNLFEVIYANICRIRTT